MPTGPLHGTVFRRRLARAVACTAALALAACQHAPPPPSNATPEKAVATNLRLTAAGDFDGLMQNRLPPAAYAQWRREWSAAHAHPVAATADQQQQFAAIMQQLTAPDAEAALLKRAEPTLATLKGGHNALPIAGSILEAAGRQVIANSPQLGPVQRSLALQTLNAAATWAQTTDFSHPKQARKAIAIICTTARSLHVQTLAQWRTLDYATTMKDYGLIWRGLESVLNVYGLDLARSLADADISVVTNDGTNATVKLGLKIAGQRLSGGWPMVKQAGHWYDAALLDAWAKAHPAPAATTVAPAGAGSAALPASARTRTAPAAPASSP
ncbi:MAG: hypothetical protein EPN38_01145 [Rhodanobacteraceae bacterium]|nr:MAG: hypothetical protein EPN38_01145 [Rhodanobacteraceae bacterium]